MTAQGRMQPENLSRLHAACTIGAIAASLCSIAGSQILLGLALAISLWRFRELQWPNWQLIPIAILFALTLLSAAASQDPAAATPQIRKFFVYLILLIVPVAFATRKQMLALVGLLLAAGSASALWSFWQYFRKWNLAQSRGEDFTTAYIADRTTGFMSHWMTFGGEMLVVLLFALAFLLFASSGRRDWFRLGSVVALVSVALLLNWTRGIWIGTAVGIVYLVWSWRRPVVLALPLVAGLAFVAGPASLRDRALSIVKPRGDMDSNDHRRAMMRTGLAIVSAHPLLGIGPEMVKNRFAEFAPADIPRPFPKQWWYNHLHSIYFQFAAERGVPALFALLAFAGLTMWHALQAAKRAADPAARAFLHATVAMWIGILVTGLFEYNLGDSEVLLLVLGISAVSAVVGRFAPPKPA